MPKLEKLIETCGDDFFYLMLAEIHFKNGFPLEGEWMAESLSGLWGTGDTPVEAVSNLHLALEKNDIKRSQ